MWPLSLIFSSKETTSEPELHPAKIKPLTKEKNNEKAIIGAKMALVAATMIGFGILAIYFGGLTNAAVHAHSRVWQQILFGGLCATSIISVISSVFFSYTNDMNKATKHNIKDSLWFFGETAGSALYLGAAVVNFAIKVGLLNMLLNQDA